MTRLSHSSLIRLKWLYRPETGSGRESYPCSGFSFFVRNRAYVRAVETCLSGRCMLYLVYNTHGSDRYETTHVVSRSRLPCQVTRRSCLFRCFRLEKPGEWVVRRDAEKGMRKRSSSTVMSLNVLAARMLATRQMDLCSVLSDDGSLHTFSGTRERDTTERRDGKFTESVMLGQLALSALPCPLVCSPVSCVQRAEREQHSP